MSKRMVDKDFEKADFLEKDPVIRTFYNKVQKVAGKHLKGFVLFGSRARGDNKAYSDYDFLIILEYENTYMVDGIRDAEVHILNTFDVLVNAIIISEEGWQRRKTLPFGRNILREGFAL
ncbi:MAG: nucleotidyltransferase domain-containing protein [Spirochaetaceae bacterium]